MSDIAQKIANLSPEKRQLFLERLKNKNGKGLPQRIIRQARDGSAFPLSFAQQRLWLLDRLEPNNVAYNIPLAFRLSGRLSAAALEQAIDEIVRRHEILRTTLGVVKEQPVQIINAETAVSLPVVDLSRLSATEREAEAQRFLIAESRRPFDLSRGPLLRSHLLRLSETEHVLLSVMHHIISDGWSLGVFVRELAQLYTAFWRGKPSPLPELSVQYADYAVWQRQWLQGKELEAQLAFWRQQLAGTPPLLELPADRPRPAIPTYRGGLQPVRVPKSLLEPLEALCHRENVTLFMAMLAAFKVLLYRYSGQGDIVVGSPISGRNHTEIESLIGFFVNNLVLRSPALQDDPTFRELLAHIRETALGAFSHQDLPFEKLVEELNPARNMSYSPLFQAMFILHDAPEPPAFPHLALSPLHLYNGMAKFDLTLELIHFPHEIAGAFEYCTDLFDAATIARMAGHFERLLQSIVENPDRRISSLALLPEPERRQMLVEWNDTRKEYPQAKCWHHLFEEQVERTPEQVAQVFGEQQLTYGELNRRTNQLAHHLRKRGVGPEVLVGICMERSLEMMVGLLGILKAGGAYVPLDPAYPVERIAYVLEDAKVPLLLTTQATIDNYQLAIDNCQLVCLDTGWPAIAEASTDNPVVEMAPENLAYAIYTSGSTGKPKGVAIPHRALVNFLTSMREAPGLGAGDSLLAVTTLSFDIAGLELYLPLLAGGRVVLASREGASDSRRLMAALEESGATVMQATPATWRMLIESGWRGKQNLKILCGGEALPRELANQLLERGASLWNMYGPTETTIWSAVHKIENREGLIAIGGPIANTQIYLLDRHRQIVPLGVHGELCIGGDGLARGYLNRPELTAEKFIPISDCEFRSADLGLHDEASAIPNPQSPMPGARLYNTGDLARYLPDGKIDCLGRVDHQVKIRGFRIELGEIESVCKQHPAVKDVVVTSASLSVAPRGVEGLVAYVVTAVEPKPAVNELRQHLLKQLPEYMVPSLFMFLEALPLTPNGKVDRKALPAPQAESKAGVDEAKNSVESLLAEIWREVLGLNKVGLHDNFFELGGHSLLAVRLFLEIERSFNRSLPLASIFKAPTIKELAALLGNTAAAGASGCLVALQDKGEKSPLFCVSGYDGHTFIFRQLATHLGDDQPVYGLHYPGLEGEQPPLMRVEDIATEFIRHIRRAQPHGPYRFCGFCFGGLVVYEMAQQLVSEGQTVDMLVLFDTFAPGGVRAPNPAEPIVLYDEELNHLGDSGQDQAHLETSSNGRDRRGSASLDDWIAAVRNANIQAHIAYRPRPYPGRVIVFRPTKRAESWKELILDPLNGWGELARDGVEVCSISGYHEKMFREPKVQKVAKKMLVYLRKKREARDRDASPVFLKPMESFDNVLT